MTTNDGSFSWKLVKTVTQRVKIHFLKFFYMLLFGYESLTSLVYINIKHKLTGWQELVHYVRSVSLCYRRCQKSMNKVGSVASLTLASFIIPYFLIYKGISVKKIWFSLPFRFKMSSKYRHAWNRLHISFP